MFLRSPISTVVTIPIYNYWLYPTLRKLGFNFSPVRRSKSLLLPDVCLTNDPSLSLRRCVEQGRPLHVELQLTVSLRLPLRRGDHDHLCNPAVAGLRDVAMRLPRHRVRRWQRCVAYCELSLLFLRAWSACLYDVNLVPLAMGPRQSRALSPSPASSRCARCISRTSRPAAGTLLFNVLGQSHQERCKWARSKAMTVCPDSDCALALNCSGTTLR